MTGTIRDGARVTTFAGRRGSLLPAEDVPATAARLGGPLALARHPLTGDIYIACQESHSVRMVNASGDIVTIAGTGAAGFSGDGGSAKNAQLNWPAALAFADDGTLYVSDMLNNRIRKITPDGRIHTFAGTGSQGYSGDGGPADQAELHYPAHLAFGPDGNLYFSDMNNHRVRRIQMASPHRIDSVAGNGQRGFSSDGTPATSARLNLPRGLAFGPDGILYIVDSFNRKIRAVRLEVAPALTKRD
jgi:sugar lactone lactonase YvrE